MVVVALNATPSLTPLSHVYELAPVPDTVTGSPSHTVWSAPAPTVGSGFMVTSTWSVFSQPFPSVPVTV